MKFSAVFLALLTAGIASAQFDNIPQCSVQCLVDALTKDGCSQLTDFACHCQKPGLVQTVTPCVQKACTGPEQATVSSVVVEQCAKAGHPISVPPAGGAGSGSATATATAAPTSGSAQTTSGVMTLPTVSSSGHAGSSSRPGSSSPGWGSSSRASSGAGSPTSHAPSATTSTLLATGAASQNRDNMVGVAVAAAAAVCLF
ncbi:CFEM-domain-containing protein [Aspergillus steynii IBT 23096]|uniref:CFEM-domain-containing protein n=1 Tax=Aspergillus steynii IBT 23096 TaxID=1392250 RepID=A0A2I2G3R6_9EURO|nr:CFEM-domain-containing protein [Aspergillus steynii IBT 23096]PLB47524.1 CFEM-domain-containing protein [Aspergillus steynii IBT 23096]